MPIPSNVKVIHDEDTIQEAEIRIKVPNADEVKNAIAVLAKLRKEAAETIDLDEGEPDEGEIVVTSFEYAVEGDEVIVHVAQGIVE